MKTKKWIILIGSVVVIAIVAFFFWNNQRPKLEFCGKVVDEKAQPVVGARVEIGKSVAKTDEKGGFTIKTTKSDRFVLNVTKLGFGLVSKIYNVPKCDISIAMTQATVATDLRADEPIVIEDTTSVITEPLGLNNAIASPIDTIPFVLSASGSLIGFGNPPELAETYQAADQTRGETNRERRRRTRVEVPPNALEDPEQINEGSFFTLQSKEPITGSVSTVDIYSPDGMPGDYSVRLKDGSIGYMETYGAADVNFYRNGKPLQLKQGMYATISIPVDTVMLVYYGNKLPQTMPLLVYNKKSGEWGRDIDKWTKKESLAQLNKDRTAYVGKVSHFSVFNMDEEFADPACFKITTSPAMVTGGATPSTIQVYVGGHIKPFYPFGNDCPDGTVYAHSIVKMTPFSPMGVRIADNSGQVRSTYVFIAGASSSPSVPDCPYSSCTASANMELRQDECWMTTTPAVDGTMQAPILAVRRGADLNNDNTISNDALVDRDGDGLANLQDNEDNYFTFSWLYINGVTGTTVTNTPRHYRIKYKTFLPGDSFTFNVATEPPTTILTVDFDVEFAGEQLTYPISDDAGSNEWKFEQSVAFVGDKYVPDNDSESTASNPLITSSQIVVFRIDHSSDEGISFSDGIFYVLNMPASTANFYSSFTGANSCYTH